MQSFLKYFFLILLISVANPSFGQQRGKTKSKAQLEREKRENLNRIKEANRILQQTKQQKEASIGQLNAIQEKITVQKGLIRNISSELTYIETDMKQTESTVSSLKTDLEKLKAEYAAMVYGAAKTANSYNKMMFLFASDSFNQFVRRLSYLRQYSEARKKQVAQINNVQTSLEQKIAILSTRKQEKKNLLHVQVKENKNLLSLKNQQSTVITQLSRQEENLRQEVVQRQQAVQKLNNLIADMVREEIARSARAARANAAKNPEAAANTRVNRVTLTPETALLSSSFGGNRGRFSWPVERGFISQRFGVHPHPVLKQVSTQNNGIEIQTNSGERARAIFKGKVTAVANIAGLNNIVMIQHGEYFTVYAKLKSVNVSEGQAINAHDVIGNVYTNSEGTTELHFEIWRNGTKLNPEGWLLTK
ncbi:murein hydrolase activator EnvC family protein [Adhaeribacter aquaticus]|uniref:murein hydrolase activator EnvC family protein n=1 Tax=Adhaeribacter aquaticus TaxID=299567 RepID=UPI00041D8FAE|nr:peptidoglycan DD-metalloendopeptidase family protein [Adhaeribacter aquaticus]